MHKITGWVLAIGLFACASQSLRHSYGVPGEENWQRGKWIPMETYKELAGYELSNEIVEIRDARNLLVSKITEDNERGVGYSSRNTSRSRTLIRLYGETQTRLMVLVDLYSKKIGEDRASINRRYELDKLESNK